MGEKSYRVAGMSDWFARYEFPENLHVDMDNPVQEITKRIMAEVADLTDAVMVDAILRACQSEGITDLYLIDKKFIIEAITEKLEREKNDI